MTLAQQEAKGLVLAELGFVAPGGRTYRFGPQCGEAFREKHLRPALERNEVVRIMLDGSTGGTTSFYDEAIGALIREGVISREDAERRIKVWTSDEDLEYIPRLVRVVVKHALRKR